MLLQSRDCLLAMLLGVILIRLSADVTGAERANVCVGAILLRFQTEAPRRGCGTLCFHGCPDGVALSWPTVAMPGSAAG